MLGAPLPADPRLFFEPVQFHVELTDLRVQAIWIALRVNWFRTSLTVKKYRRLLNQFFLPLPNLGRMHVVLLGNLVDRLDAPYRLQGYLGFLLPAETVSLEFAHILPFLLIAGYSLNSCPVLRAHYNIGKAYVQEDHWDRLVRLNAVLSAKLSPEEPYLDLTSRNAQYFYLNRRPVMAVTAPYNMVPPSQQKRAVEQLSKNLPTLALLEGANIIHDGGSLALRNPYLYRFIVDNYNPRFEDGFIVGYKKTLAFNDDESIIDVAVKNITDKNWDRGFHRLEAAIIISDPVLISFIKVGDQVRIGSDELRRIKRIQTEGNAVWLEGAPIVPVVTAYPNIIHVTVNPQSANEYRASLFQRSFSQSDFQKIPVAWGRSEKSLKNKMTLTKSFDGISPSLHQLIPESRDYKVNGVDPYLIFDISSLDLSGRDAGLLRFDFTCTGKSTEPRIQVFWWGDDHVGPFEASSVRFTADNGTLIVPLDASPFWLTLKKIKGIRIDLDNATACSAFSIKKMGLFQRHF